MSFPYVFRFEFPRLSPDTLPDVFRAQRQRRFHAGNLIRDLRTLVRLSADDGKFIKNCLRAQGGMRTRERKLANFMSAGGEAGKALGPWTMKP